MRREKDLRGISMIDVSEAEASVYLAKWERECRASHERAIAAERGRTHTISATVAPWWAVVANVNCERRAMLGLHDRGFETWRPSRWIEVRLGKARASACRQTFPMRYVFARHADPRAWPEMVGVNGLRAIVCMGSDPVRVSPGEIDDLKRRLAPGDFPVIDDAYRIGQHVRITGGPFAAFQAVVEAVLPKGRVEVALSVFGRPTPLQLDREQVERV